jgi:MFS family permease
MSTGSATFGRSDEGEPCEDGCGQFVDRTRRAAGVVTAAALSPVAVALTGLLALAVAMGIGRFAFTPILPMMQVDAGLSLAAGGWLASANYLGYLIGALAAMAVRVQGATAIRAGLATIGVTTLAMGAVHHVVAWGVLRALAGVASAWVLIYVSAWSLERLTPLRRPALNSTVYAGVGTGIAVAGAFCLVLMRMQATSAQAWLGLGILSLGATAWIWSMVSSDGARAADVGAARHGHRWDAESVRLVFCYGSFGFGYIIPATFLPVMAREVIADPALFGWAWPVFGAAAASSTFVAAALARTMANRRLWMAGQLTMAAGVAVPVLWPGLAGIMLAALFVGGTFVLCTMVGLQEARLVAGAHATGLMAAMTAAFALGQILGPLSVSYAIRAGASMSAALLVACVLLVVSGAALAGSRSPRRG